ncbi:uncharacterized protein LOC131313940 [Rhododendron vialii]|uniref:uncharacterized protein LOC131313940 n=1 Tax=Rhododendron vialii TaxID=182163 RepID=UPI00265E723D|nr:uncharacterized protein LOC131313940 [Rhododendron vialii]
MKPVKDQPSHIPAWVRLHDLPLELWNQECLSRVASTIGKPLHVDQATAKTSRQPGLLQTKSTSAGVCIEISAEHDLPEDVKITIEGKSVVVPNEYQVLPLMCKQCQVFGHSTTQCSKKSASTSSDLNPKMSNGKQGNDLTFSTPYNTSSISPTSTKHITNIPQAVVADAEDELVKVLECIVSSSQETLIVSAISHIPSTSNLTTDIPVELLEDSEEAEEESNNKVANSLSQQPSSPAAPLSRSAAKKAAKIAAKLKDKEPPDIKLLIGGSTKAGQFGRQKSTKSSSHRSGNHYTFVATFIYEANCYLDRQQLWIDLQQHYVITPWVVLGDFNAIRNPKEKLGDAHISTKIDRVLVNESWIKDFCWSNAHFLNPGVSDHSPAQVWRKVIIGNPMYCVYEKLKNLQENLKKLNTNEFSDLSSRVASYKQQLEAIQRVLGSNPSDTAKQTIERDLCKQNRNRISSLVLEDGSVTQDIELVKHTFINYDSKLLGSKHLNGYSGSSRSLNPQKAPGPDGYNVAFFHKAWPVIGHEVTSAVKLFFRSGQLLKKANATLVALVPKVPNPSKVGDFRPISCCNVGRRIADNIFLTQELMRGYHKHSSSPRCAMKVDIMKAYDNVRWDFLWDVLTSMNFQPKMIQWLKAYFSTANYSLCFNGEAIGYIPGQKGLRQGDPLSSYLFVTVIEVLTCILKEKSLLPDFKFHWECGSTKLVNLCFADYLMIFCKGEVNSINHIKQALTEFETLSGLSPSPSKSNIFFSGVNTTTKFSILNILGF